MSLINIVEHLKRINRGRNLTIEEESRNPYPQIGGVSPKNNPKIEWTPGHVKGT